MMTAYTAVLGRQAVIIVTNCKYPTFLAFTQEKRMVSLLNFCLLKNMNFKPLKNNKIERLKEKASTARMFDTEADIVDLFE